MKKIVTMILCMVIYGISYGTDVSGTISVNTTWNIAGSPYIVIGDVSVNSGVTLTVDPNVVVKFNSSRRLDVLGTLTANTATFTSNQVSPAPGDWQYIQIGNTSFSGTANLTGCFIRYAQQFIIYSGTATLSNSNLEYLHYYGVNVYGTLNMTGGVIDLLGYYGSYGYGIYAQNGSASTLNGTSIIRCNQGIYLNTNSTVNLTSCSITNNLWPLIYQGAATLTIGGSCNFTANDVDAFYVAHSTHTGTWTLPTAAVPYYMYNGYTVANGTTMVIGSQNILKFRYGTMFDIRGTLTADAAIGQNIFFTSDRDDNWGGDTNNDGTSTAPAVSNWYGVRFYNESNDASVMRRCKLRYAGYGSIGGISLYDAGPTIDLCELQQNYFGALFQNTSSPTFTNNTVGSSQLTPIAMSFEANPTFTNNVLSFMDNQYDAIGLLGGTLTANANIIQRNFTTVSNITYVMLAEITVPSGLTLTIDPGVVIKSPSNSYRIIIQGKLVADATSANWITFTSARDDNFGNPSDTNKDGTISTPVLGDLGGIIFDNGYDPTSIMDYVRMKYATAYGSYPNGGQNHYIYASAVATIAATTPVPAGPTISNCEFRDLTYGICCYQASNPTISNNSMINNTGTPFAIAASANPTFVGNTFTNVGMRALGLIGNNVVVNGTIYKRNVAGYTNITYVLLEDLTISNLTNLTVNAGVVIKMQYKSIYVDGGFKCNGTPAEKVIFTSLYDDNVGNPMDSNGDGNATTPSRGNWYFVQYRDNSDDVFNTITYTNLQYGGAGGDGVLKFLNAGTAPTSFNQTLIDQSYFGIICVGNSAPSFSYVTIQNCYYDPIAMSLSSNPTFSDITFSANGSNGVRIIDLTLSADATLVKRSIAGFSNIAYIIPGTLSIASSATLTLQQGIILKFYSGGFQVNGGLIAVGTSGEKIYFTALEDDAVGGDTNNDGSASVPTNSSWFGIWFYPESIDANNKLIYCEIRYTGGGYTNPFGTDTYYGAVRIKDAYVQIDNTVFQQGNGSAVGIFGSANPAVSNCQMYNFTHTPVYMAMFSNPTFSNISLSNIGLRALGIQTETYSQTATIPQRSFAGYSNITYLINGITINSGTTITIPAGTVIKTQSGQGIVVNGKLTVSGTSGNRVVFTDYRDDSYGNPADTEQNGSATSPNIYGPYIQFNDVSDDASTIDYAIMRYTTDAVRLYSASPSINFTTFNYGNYGITNLGVCTPVINNNTFDNLIYAPMSISLVAYPSSALGNIISGTTYKCLRVNDETLTQDVTLPKRSFGGVSNIPYYFGNYTIGTGVTLTISPGIVCKFAQYGTITVNNGLIAEGLLGAMQIGNIIFTSITDDFHGGDSNSDGTATSSGSSTWSGIIVNDVALDPQTRFAYCIFRHATASYGAIRLTSASPSIQYCNFNANSRGVYATAASNPTVNYCDFYDITYEAVNNVNQSFVINAENCWWGSNTGPTHSGNPGGTGEPVTNSVDYLPFGTSGVINPMMGDVSLNGNIQAYDASLVLQHVVTIITLNSTQQIVADVSGSAGITAYDASLILFYVIEGINYFPAELLNPLPQYTSQASLAIGSATAMPGEEFELPLSLNDVDQVFAGQMTINYDPDYLEATEIESLMPEMTFVSDIDDEYGIIHISFAGVEALVSDLEFASVHFKAKDNLPTMTIPIEGKFFMANESNLSSNITDGTVTINSIATGLNDQSAITGKTLSCYPNPVRDKMTIEYKVVNDGDNVQITIYNQYSEIIVELVNGKHAAENYSINWNTGDAGGERLPGGTYIIRLTTANKTEVQKIQIVR